MKRKHHVTATDLAECCVCEQRVVFDRMRGKRRSGERWQHMQAGQAMHAELHRQAKLDLVPPVRDARCFVASALWGADDSRTEVLRTWRDRWLLTMWCGPALVKLYYASSPRLVCLMLRCPRMLLLVDGALSAVVRFLEKKRP